MQVNGRHFRTVWMEGSTVYLIEQNLLPFEFKIYTAKTYQETCQAIQTMIVRGAGAIGAAAGFAMAQAFLAKADIEKARAEIKATRPTAQNLFYAIERVFSAKDPVTEAQMIADEDAENCRRIGEIGNSLIKEGANIETHCNAGWLAFVDYGTALSPIYQAHHDGKNIFVYVDETRPRNQGARLTAWELGQEKVPHVIIPDNAGAALMAQGKIDLMIVGADRIAVNGDVANKIGTLEKAIVAKEFGVPFYVAAPSSTFDPNCPDGKSIPIEERSPDEVLSQSGMRIAAPGSTALNLAFDVTPAKYISGIITEKGIINVK